MSNRQLNFSLLGIGILIGAISASALFLIFGMPSQPTNIETPAAQNIPTPPNKNENTRLNCGDTGITGRVANAQDSTVVTGANVFTDPPTSSVTTDSDGNFIICNIDWSYDGRQFTVYAVKNGYSQGQAIVEISSNNTIIADMIIQKNP